MYHSVFRQMVKEYTRVLVGLVVLDILFWLLTASSNVYVEPVSRRYANMTYILWIVSHEEMSVSVLCDVDTLA